MIAADVRAAKPTFRGDPEYLIDNWETDDGLPENSATAVVQTPDGYLWFGTFDGLVRFDGLTFTVFDSSNTPAMGSAGVVNLHLDGSGRLWVSTLGGLVLRQDRQWRTVGPPDGWKGEFFVRTFAERDGGELLITTFDGRVLEFAGGQLRVLPAPPGEPGKGYFGAADDGGQWWVAQHRFIGRWDGARWESMVEPGEASPTQVGAAAARGGGLWVLIGQELRKYRGGREVARRTISGLRGGVWSLSEDGDGNVWICTFDRGLYRAGPDGQVRHWSTVSGLPYDGTRVVFEDRERNLWVGTSGGGLVRFKRRDFRSFGVESGLSERVVNSVCADRQGSVWMGSYGKGLFRLSGGQVNPVPLDAAGGVKYVQSVLADRTGRVWVGSFNQGLWRVEGDAGRRVGGAELDRENVLALFEDSRGCVWIGGGQGLWVYDAGDLRTRRDDDGSRIRAVYGFTEDERGDVWLTNGEAVFRFREGRIEHVTAGDGQPIRDVACLKADGGVGGGAVWMGTTRSGLIRWREGRLARVDSAAGLPGGAVRAIVEDDAGYFWMTSNRGVIRAHRRDLDAAADGRRDAVPLRYRVFDASDGLPSAEGSTGRQPVAARDGGGRIWVATPKGVAVVDPARLGVSPAPPATHVEELSYEGGTDAGSPGAARGRRTSVGPPFAGRVVLPAGSRHVEFRYTGLSLAAPEKVRFQVRVEGRDSDWQDVGHDRVAHYHTPAPGEYVFRVRAAGPDGRWEGAGASLGFRVRPFVWQTTWFRGGAAGVLLAAMGGGLVWVLQGRHRRLTDAARRGREQSAALVGLSRSPAAARGEIGAALAEATEAAARVLGVAKVGIWLIGEGGGELRCADRFDAAAGGAHEQGDVLRVSGDPGYLERLRGGRVIDSADVPHDARRKENARTSASSGGGGGGGGAALHAAVRTSGQLVGVVRLESAGAARVWRADETAFAAAVADHVAQVLSNARRERAARELRESEERFRLVVEAAPNGMVMVDAHGRIAMVNAAVERVFGYARQELVGRPLDALLPGLHRGRGNGEGERGGEGDVAIGETDTGHELCGRRADGREVAVEIGVNPMDTAEGRFVLCSITDVSERKRAEAQAAQLRNELTHLSRVTMLGELSGSLAHELNQPLTSILSNAQAAQHFLARGDPDFREVGEILADIVAEDKRAGEVIRRLRALFKKGEVQRQSLDVNDVLGDVLKLARSDLINHGVAVEVRPGPGLPPVIGDRVQLQQVLLNLIKNGCDAMAHAEAEARQLEIRSAASPDGAAVRVSIRDRGCGVAAGDVERIFEPFVSTKPGGMGLGLAVCRTIVQSHGGRLWLENNRDQGATVHLVLPAAREEAVEPSRGDGGRGRRAGALDQSLIVRGRTAE